MRMKTMLMGGLVAGLLGLATPLPAQIGIGVFGGLSFSNLHGSDKDAFTAGASRSGRTGFLAGAMLDVPLGIVSIRPQVFYVQKGVRYSDSSGELGFNQDYIEVPLLLVVTIPTSSNIKPELFAGPQVAFRTKCDVTGTPSGGSETKLPCDDPTIQAELESTDFGILVGGGVAVGNFMAQVAFDYGLTTVDAEVDPFDIKTQAFYALVGWMFRLP